MIKINNLSLSGRIIRDAEFKVSKKGLEYAVFTIAHEAKENDVMFLDCIYFDAKAARELDLQKGVVVIVDGKLTQNSFLGADGKRIYRFKIMANSLVLENDAVKAATKQATAPLKGQEPTKQAPTTQATQNTQAAAPLKAQNQAKTSSDTTQSAKKGYTEPQHRDIYASIPF